MKKKTWLQNGPQLFLIGLMSGCTGGSDTNARLAGGAQNQRANTICKVQKNKANCNAMIATKAKSQKTPIHICSWKKNNCIAKNVSKSLETHNPCRWLTKEACDQHPQYTTPDNARTTCYWGQISGYPTLQCISTDSPTDDLT